jgi:hypothetical protein
MMLLWHGGKGIALPLSPSFAQTCACTEGCCSAGLPLSVVAVVAGYCGYWLCIVMNHHSVSVRAPRAQQASDPLVIIAAAAYSRVLARRLRSIQEPQPIPPVPVTADTVMGNRFQ